LDNIPRVLPQGVDAVIDVVRSGWSLPPVFKWLQSVANLPQSELLRTWNCGIGMIIIVSSTDVDVVLDRLRSAGEDLYVLGSVQAKDGDQLNEDPKVVVIGEVN